MGKMKTQPTVRRYYLDWVRVGVILTVFIYHSTRFFNLGGWHVKNPVTYGMVELFQNVLETWMMPLAFLVSGAAVYYALGKGASAFVKDKILRLLVPLVVGIFTHSILQIYLERVSHGQFSGTLLEFLPRYFDGLYGFGGNFAWMGVHLWYVLWLFVFSLLFLPVWWLFRRGPFKVALSWITRVLAVPLLPFLLVLPAIFIRNGIPESDPLGMTDWGGWGLVSHLWFFISGYVIASSDRMWASIERLRWVWLAGAVLLTASQVISALPHPGDYANVELQGYLWMYAFLGLAARYLNYTNSRIQYANEAVLPFYILHQPVLIVIGFFVVQSAIPDGLKWAIIAASSLVVIAVLYEGLVRRYNILRVLFGMKPTPRPESVRVPGKVVYG